MALFSSADIVRFLNDGEDNFVQDYPCIIDRLSLSIVAGTASYTLPDYVQSIHKVTWLGNKIDPVSQRSLRESQLSGIQQGVPDSYIFNNITALTIQFFPTPSATIASISSNLYSSEIPNRVIVQFYRMPDHATFQLPSYFRRRLLKNYINKMCFLMEGKGQSLKAAKYYSQKWENLKIFYGSMLEEFINQPRHLIIGKSLDYQTRRVPQGQLPYSYQGIGVDKGE